MKTRAFDPETKQWRTDYVVMPDGSIHRSFKVDNGVEFMGFYEIAEQVNWKLSRFTNWKDTNENVICQHHIVDSINSRRRYLIDWDENTGSFVARRIYSNEEYANYPFVERTARNCTIIGDVFRNPELLEVE